MKSSLLKRGLALSFLMSFAILAWSNDVTVTDNSGNNINGAFVAGVWTPTGPGPSTIDYGNLLTELINGDVDITAVGNLSFTSSASTPAGLLYDLAVDRTLNLSSGGNVNIENYGINAVSPPNTGKLTININSTAPDGQFSVKDWGLETNGGDINILDFDKVYLNGNAIIADGTMSAGNLNVTANVFKFGIDEMNNIDGSIVIAGNVQLTIADTVEMEHYTFQLSGQLTINTEDLTSERGSFTYTPASSDPSHSLSINAQNINAKFFQIDWKEDVEMSADSVCLEGFTIRDFTPGHETDIDISGTYANLQYGHMRLRDGLDGRNIKVEMTEKLILNGVIMEMTNSDGNISAIGADSLFINGPTKSGSDCGTGGQLRINNGNGQIYTQGDYTNFQYVQLNLDGGNGIIKVDAADALDWRTSQAIIEGDASNTTINDLIEVNTTDMRFGFSEISIKENTLKGAINITATDSLLARSVDFPCFGEASGGFIGFGNGARGNSNNDPNLGYPSGFGDLNIQTGYFDAQWLYMGHGAAGGGDLNIDSDILKLFNSSIETGAGKISVVARDTMDLEQSGIKVLQAADDNSIFMQAKSMCLLRFMVLDTAINNTTDILVEADNAHFQYGEFNVRNGKDTRSIKLDIAEVLKHTGVSVTVDRSDGNLEVIAQDSMFLYAFDKEGGNFGTGGRIGIREGNGKIKVESNYIFEQFYEKGIVLGSGRVDIKADKYVTNFSIPAHIVGPEAGGQTKGDTIIIDTRVYSQGYAEVSITNNEQPSFINIIATDSLNAGVAARSISGTSDSRGGFIGFGARSKSVDISYTNINADPSYVINETNAQANGDLQIDAGYFTSQWLYMGQQYGEGDIQLNTTGNCILLNSSFEHYGARGDVSVDVGGKLKISQAEIAQKSGTGNTDVIVGDSLLLHTGSILQSADGDINVEAGGDLYMTFAKISHQGNNSYNDRGNPVGQYTGNLSVSAQNLVLPTMYDYSEPGAENRTINGTSNSSIHADVVEGDVKVVVEDSVFLRQGAITNTVQSGNGNLTLQANILDMDNSCLVLDGSNDLLKVQVERIEYEFAGIEAKNGDASIIVAGETMTTENACVGTDGGDIFLTFKNDIDLTHTYLGSKGGNIDVASLEGGVSVTNGDDPSNQPDGTDGIFTGDTGVDGGNLMISACTSIDIAADINTGAGSGGAYSEMGMPITTASSRRFIGQGNAEMIIDDNCTMLEVSITDPCSCENPSNVYDGLDLILFHETVVLTAAPGDTWELVEILEGAVFDQSGNEITDLSSIVARPEINGDAVDYIFEFWHEPGVGYNGIFEATAGPSIGQRQGISNSCDAELCMRIAANLPTIPKWSLFLLSILLLSMSIFFFTRSKG